MIQAAKSFDIGKTNDRSLPSRLKILEKDPLLATPDKVTDEPDNLLDYIHQVMPKANAQTSS